MIREVRHAPKITICQACKGTGTTWTEYSSFNVPKVCPQCEGSGRVTVSTHTVLDIRPYRPRTHETTD